MPERFDRVRVAPHGFAPFCLDEIVPRTHRDNHPWALFRRSKFFQQRAAIHSRQTHVRQHRVKSFVGSLREGKTGIIGKGAMAPREFQNHAQHRQSVGMILYDEDFGRSFAHDYSQIANMAARDCAEQNPVPDRAGGKIFPRAEAPQRLPLPSLAGIPRNAPCAATTLPQPKRPFICFRPDDLHLWEIFI